MPSNAISLPFRSMALTPKQNGQDDEEGTHCYAGIGHIKDRKPANFEEIQYVAPMNAINKIAQSASQNKGHARLDQLAVNLHRQQDHEKNERDNGRHNEKDRSSALKDPECAAVIVNSCEANRSANQAVGLPEYQCGGCPPLGGLVDQQKNQC